MQALESLTLQFRKKRFSRHEVPFGDEAVAELLEGLTVLRALEKLDFCENSESLFHRNVPLPINLRDYQNLRHLTRFIVDGSRFV